MKRMYKGVSASILDNAFLKAIYDSAYAQGFEWGLNEAREKFRTKAAIEALRDLLQDKFGPLPKRAAKRLGTAASTSADLWTHRILQAESLEEVIGGK